MSPVLQINTDVNTELLCLWPAYLPRAHLRVFSRVSRVSAKPNASVSLHVAVPTPRVRFHSKGKQEPAKSSRAVMLRKPGGKPHRTFFRSECQVSLLRAALTAQADSTEAGERGQFSLSLSSLARRPHSHFHLPQFCPRESLWRREKVLSDYISAQLVPS